MKHEPENNSKRPVYLLSIEGFWDYLAGAVVVGVLLVGIVIGKYLF